MKKLLLGIGLLCFTMTVTAQEQDIFHFQQQHPNVAFISKDRISSFTEEEIDLLKGNYIIYNSEIENADLTSYINNSHTKSAESIPSDDTEMSSDQKDLVKIWLANHPLVKIVKHSEFDALSEADKLVYQAAHCMILLGEIVTLTDIELYPY